MEVIIIIIIIIIFNYENFDNIFTNSPPVAFITTFVTFFGLVIALTKDLSDIEGDRK